MSAFFKNIKIQMIFFTWMALFFASCSESGEKSVFPESNEASVRFEAALATVPLADSLVLDLSGPEALHKSYTENFSDAKISLVPGVWNFKARFYANGILLQQGETSQILKAGDDVNISINMHAVAGFLYVKIPLGAGNPLGISSGKLEVSGAGASESEAFSVDKLYATVASGILKLDSSYSVKLFLFNSQRDTLYSYSGTVSLSSENFVPIWDISSLRANARFSIVSDSSASFSAVGHLPSKTRGPKAGDLFITEFSVSLKPKFIEYYNSSLDTLNLDGCAMAFLSASSSSPKDFVDTLNAVKLPPQSFFIAGSDSADFADVKGSLTMPSTKGSLIFHCRDIIIDSLYYVNTKDAGDSLQAFPISDKGTTQLPLLNFDKRSSGNAWCAGEPSPHTETSCK